MSRLVFLRLLVVVAASLIALGLFWNRLFPVTSYWTEEQAKEYRDAFYTAHAMQDAIKDGKLAADSEQLQAARDRYLQIQRDLNTARIASSRNGNVTFAVGVLALLSAIALRQFWSQAASRAK
jgi:hypothetical protein